MPFYEYHCSHCREAFTIMRPIADRDEPATCPECGEFSSLRELSVFSAAGGASGDSGDSGGGCGSGGFT